MLLLDEARFVFEGRPRHELLFVWEATFADPALQSRDELHGTEIDGSPIHARWLPLSEARAALEELAQAFSPQELEQRAYKLYEQFRPEIPEGMKGWGAAGDLDLERIHEMAEKLKTQR